MGEINLSHYSTFFIDMDGVLVRSDEPIPGAKQSFCKLARYGDIFILSNNSTKSRRQFSSRLQDLGFEIEYGAILNSAYIVSSFLFSEMGSVDVFPVGEKGLKKELVEMGHRIVEPETADVVVAGMDRGITYDKLSKALRALMAGARFFATNLDKTFPTPEGQSAGAGATVGAIQGMGFPPEEVVGKPSIIAAKIAQERAAVSYPSRCLVVGDRLETDIELANKAGMDSVLTLTGVEDRSSLTNSRIKPTIAIESLSDLLNLPRTSQGLP